MLGDGAGVFRRLGEERGSKIIEIRQNVARVRNASFALTVEDDAAAEEFFGFAERFLHQRHVAGSNHDRGRNQITETLIGLRLAVFPGELVNGARRLASDFAVFKTALL